MLPSVTDVLPTVLPFKLFAINDVTDVTDFSHTYTFLPILKIYRQNSSIANISLYLLSFIVA
jgi:hypothetical protein